MHVLGWHFSRHETEDAYFCAYGDVYSSETAYRKKKKKVVQDLILFIGNWLDGCGWLLTWSHVSDRLSHPHTENKLLEKRCLCESEETLFI